MTKTNPIRFAQRLGVRASSMSGLHFYLVRHEKTIWLALECFDRDGEGIWFNDLRAENLIAGTGDAWLEGIRLYLFDDPEAPACVVRRWRDRLLLTKEGNTICLTDRTTKHTVLQLTQPVAELKETPTCLRSRTKT